MSPKISSESLIFSINLIENEWEILSNAYIFKFSSLCFKFCVLNRNRILFCFIQSSGNFWERIKVLRKLVSETTWNNFPSLRFTQTKFKYFHFQRIVQGVFWQDLTAYGGDCVKKICSQSFQEYENIYLISCVWYICEKKSFSYKTNRVLIMSKVVSDKRKSFTGVLISLNNFGLNVTSYSSGFAYKGSLTLRWKQAKSPQNFLKRLNWPWLGSNNNIPPTCLIDCVEPDNLGSDPFPYYPCDIGPFNFFVPQFLIYKMDVLTP